MGKNEVTWPHHAEQLRKMPRPADIEEIGRQIIYRGIANRRMVAFVGAGFSRIYGRPDWKTMVDELVVEVAGNLFKLISGSGGGSKDFTEEATNIINLLTDLGVLGGEQSAPLPSSKEQGDFFANVVRLQVLDMGYQLTQSKDEKKSTIHFPLAKRFNRSEGGGGKSYKFTESLSGCKEFLPLTILSSRFGIKRFATTNYDRELEGAIEKLRDPNKSDSPQSTAGEIPSKWHQSLSMVPENLVKALAFAIQGRLPRTTILHLHGDVTNPETMIVTESDYKRHYLRNNPDRDLADLVVRALFAANTVLYIGSSITEDDVLRPLRQFESLEIKRPDCLQVALMPARKSHTELFAQAVERYIRYGIHTVHYGWGKDSSSSPWLFQVHQCIDCIKNINAIWGRMIALIGLL